MLDQLDRALLRELQRDARQTNRELAAATHVVPSTSLTRVRALRDRGIITGFHASVDLASVGRGVQALISVKIRPPSRPVIEGFREWVIRLSEVIGVFVTSGDKDFLIHVAVPTSDDLYSFVIDQLTQRPEVADVQTSLVYEHVTATAVEPDARMFE
jgi:DNA-binding Lrp family transcriptional regulator